jgi:hypothetical protein
LDTSVHAIFNAIIIYINNRHTARACNDRVSNCLSTAGGGICEQHISTRIELGCDRGIKLVATAVILIDEREVALQQTQKRINCAR